jgi:DNA-binding response OmpR family regulator
MKRILVIDVNNDLLVVLRAALERQGFDVVASTGCDDALNMIAQYQPHLLILDIHLGSADGRVFCRQLKSMAAFSHIPVILISADIDASRDYSLFGASAFLRKPFGLALFVSLAQSLVLLDNSSMEFQQTA